MNVSAIIVTRGNVDLAPCWETIPDTWEHLAWDNCTQNVSRRDPLDALGRIDTWPTFDVSVYGRYAAIQYASHDLIYVQDDDVIVSDPQALADEWVRLVPLLGEEMMQSMSLRETVGNATLTGEYEGHLVANMPQEFRPAYPDSCLVGFGACFHRDAPQRAFERFGDANGNVIEFGDTPMWRRTCDVVFTTLTPRMLVDVPKTDREFASDPDRMWKQPDHYGERVAMLDLARKVRDS